MALQLQGLEPFGVEAIGVDLVTASQETYAELLRAMQSTGRGVLVVRDQNLNPPDLEVVLDNWKPFYGGAIPYFPGPGNPTKQIRAAPRVSALGNYIAKMDSQFGMDCKVGDQLGDYKPALRQIDEWHTDRSFSRLPSTAIALYAPAVGAALPEEGGHTLFASCERAYEQLLPSEQERLKALSSVHSTGAFFRHLEGRNPERSKATDKELARMVDTAWPLVRTHPTTGRQCLYLNPKNTLCVVHRTTGLPPDGMTDEDGVALVHELGQRIVDSGVYAHFWRPGDFVIWDNRVLLHAASPFDNNKYERFLFRMEFPGEPAVFRPEVGPFDVSSPEITGVLPYPGSSAHKVVTTASAEEDSLASLGLSSSDEDMQKDSQPAPSKL